MNTEQALQVALGPKPDEKTLTALRNLLRNVADDSANQAIRQDREFVVQVVRALPDMHGMLKQMWVEHPEGLKKFLAIALALCSSELKPVPRPRSVRTDEHCWTSLVKKLSNYCAMCSSFLAMISRSAPRYADLEVWKIAYRRVGDIGLNEDGKVYSVQEILKAAESHGLMPCPTHVALHLRRDYLLQPFREELYVAMDLVRDAAGRLGVLKLGLDYDGPYLKAVTAFEFVRGDEFIFVER